MRYCANGHCFQDDELVYCPECGMPLSSDPPEQSNQQNNQNTSPENYGQNEPNRQRKKPIGYIVLCIIIIALVFVILEMADVTNLIPSLHKAKQSESALQTSESEVESQMVPTVNTQADYYSRSKLPLFNITASELNTIMNSVFLEAFSWDDKTAPQSVWDFPVLPNNLSDLEGFPNVQWSYINSQYSITLIDPMPLPFSQGYISDLQNNIYYIYLCGENKMASESMNKMDIASVNWSVVYNADLGEYRNDLTLNGLEIEYREGCQLLEQEGYDCSSRSIFIWDDEHNWWLSYLFDDLDHGQTTLVIDIKKDTQSKQLYYSLPSGKLYSVSVETSDGGMTWIEVN